jgi:hypothetical protein
MEKKRGRPQGQPTERITLRVPVSQLGVLDFKREKERRYSLNDTIRAIIEEAAEEFMDENPNITGGKG